MRTNTTSTQPVDSGVSLALIIVGAA